MLSKTDVKKSFKITAAHINKTWDGFYTEVRTLIWDKGDAGSPAWAAWRAIDNAGGFGTFFGKSGGGRLPTTSVELASFIRTSRAKSLAALEILLAERHPYYTRAQNNEARKHVRNTFGTALLIAKREPVVRRAPARRRAASDPGPVGTA